MSNNTDKPKALMSNDLLDVIAPLVGIDNMYISRVVIDLQVNDAVRVYVEQIGNDRLLKVDWPGFLKEANISYGDKNAT